jgi:hypothetical protein
MHCGHKHMDPADITLETKNSISPMEEEIAKDSLRSHISTAATQNLVKTRTGETLSWQQVHHMKRKQEQRQCGENKMTVTTLPNNHRRNFMHFRFCRPRD